MLQSLMPVPKMTVTQVAGGKGSGGADGFGPLASFEKPYGVVVTTDKQTAYISQRDCLRSVNLVSGEVSTVEGTPGSFQAADGLVLSPDSKYLVAADTNNQRVKQVDLSTGSTIEIATARSPRAVKMVGWMVYISTGMGQSYMDGRPESGPKYGIIALSIANPPHVYPSWNPPTVLLERPESNFDAHGLEIRGTPGNELMVADYGNHVIGIVNTETGAYRVVAGGRGFEYSWQAKGLQDGIGEEVRFNRPHDILKVPGKEQYVITEKDNAKLRLLTDTGEHWRVRTLGDYPYGQGRGAFLSQNVFVFANPAGHTVNTMDLTLTFPCAMHQQGLLQGLGNSHVAVLGETQKYSPYLDGVVVADNSRWAFTGYRKLSWTSSGSLEKNLVCFKECAESQCNSETEESCCVSKMSTSIADMTHSEAQAVKASVVSMLDPGMENTVTMKDRLFGW